MEPSHIQITPLQDNLWGWVVDYPGDDNPRYRDGKAPSLDAALECIKKVIKDAQH